MIAGDVLERGFEAIGFPEENAKFCTVELSENCTVPPKAAIVFTMDREEHCYADVFARRIVVYVL